MFGLLHRLKRKTSGDVAKDRLKILLISDRISCTPDMMDRMKMDITRVISKYMKIDTDSMEIRISRENRKGRRTKSPMLYANIPILDMKH